MIKINENNYITPPQRQLPVFAECDVLVCGAGPAGIAAALAAARNGMKTLLVEKSGCLGGTWTSGLLCWIIDSHGKAGIMAEVKSDLKKLEGGKECDGNFSYKPEYMKYLLERKCLDSGVKFLLHSKVYDVIKQDNSITHAFLDTPSGLQAVKSKIFIDCSGDGNLGEMAGCSYDIGSPSSGKVQPMSMLALVSGIRCNKETSPFIAHHENDKPYENLLKELGRGGITPSYSRPTLTHLGNNLFVYIANHQYQHIAFDAESLTQATVNGRFELHQQINALKSLGGIWSGIEIIASSEHIGVREGRRLHGLYTLTVNDLISGRRFDDAVCKAEFCIDVHSINHKKGTGITNYSNYRVKPYDIPLRSLVSCDMDNLLMAGRCISGDFLAHGSYRVTGNAVPMGEATGKLAADAINQNTKVRNMVLDKVK